MAGFEDGVKRRVNGESGDESEADQLGRRSAHPRDTSFCDPPRGTYNSFPRTVGATLHDLMASGGWRHADEWRNRANKIAPTIVGGSKKHGGPDLGPTRARKAWAELGVDGLGIANDVPEKTFKGMPRLTVRMVARIQGIPDDWGLWGGKTARYRQVGNAFPPPVAAAVAGEILTSMVSSPIRKAAV